MLKDDCQVLEAWLRGYSADEAARELGLDPILVTDAFDALDAGY